MLRVCHIISGDLWAGAEVMACHLIRGLKSVPGLDLFVILLNRGRLADELRTAGVQIRIIDENIYSFPHLIYAIHKLFVADPPHILHAHRYKENLLAFCVSRGFPKIRLITTQHGLPEIQLQNQTFMGKFKTGINFQILKRYYDVVIAVSEDIRMFFSKKLNFSYKQIMVVHNGVTIPQNDFRKSDDCIFVVGSSGRLVPVKDYTLMVKIARILAGEKSIQFVLAGEGPERAKLEDSIRNYGLCKYFHLKGHVDDMEPFYQGLDLYLNTSLHEGIPMAILEAMARGLPVVAPNVGGVSEVVRNGVEGFVIDGRNPQDFAEKCLMLYKDQELWYRMSMAARHKAIKAFSVERMTEEYLRIYQNMVGYGNISFQ
jgi:L-malate glycosyltransferase